MWNATRMQRDRCTLDATTAAKVSIDIIDHLFAINIAVVIWNRDRERMIIQHPRHKRADYKVRSLKRLMHRRRLMYASSDRLKVGNIKDPGILIAIPANDIKGMKIVPITGNSSTNFKAHLVFTRLSMSNQLLRTTNITLTIGSMLKQLTIFVKIAPRRLNRAMRLYHQKSCLRAIRRDAKAKRGTTW